MDNREDYAQYDTDASNQNIGNAQKVVTTSKPSCCADNEGLLSVKYVYWVVLNDVITSVFF